MSNTGLVVFPRVLQQIGRMNPREFYKRISDLVDPARLRDKRVAVIGLGSGGCRVAAELGRFGVHLLLMDRPGEMLEEHNIVRHVLGYRALGQLKTIAMAEYIANLNPSAPVATRALDVVAERELFSQIIQRWRPDVLAVCTDNEPSKHAINEVAMAFGIGQTGGAVYDGGIGGEVYRVLPGGACYGCLAAHLHLDRHLPEHAGMSDYGASGTPSVPLAACALNMDIEQIALLQCRLTLDFLLGENAAFLGLPSGVNLCVFANRVVPGTFARPLHCEFYRVSKRKDCLVCGAALSGIEEDAQRILSALRQPARSNPN